MTAQNADITTRLWTKNFVLGTLFNFMLMTNYYIVMIIIVNFSMATYQISTDIAGPIAGAFLGGAIIARIPAGSLIKYVGRKKMLLIGSVAVFICSCLYFINAGAWFLFIVRLLHGASFGIASTAIGTISASIIPNKRKGEGIGYYMLSVTLGAAIGPFLGMFISHVGGYSLSFGCCAATALACLAFAFSIKASEEPPTPSNDKLSFERKGRRAFSLKNTFELPILSICVFAGVAYFCYSSFLAFLAPFSFEAGLQYAASFFFIVYAAGMLITRPFIGRIFDRYGQRAAMIPSFVSLVLGFILLSNATDPIILFASAALLGFAVGNIQACGLAIAVGKTPLDRLQHATSTYYISLDIGVGAGPIILGLIAPFIGYRLMFLLMGLVSLLTMFYYLFQSRAQT